MHCVVDDAEVTRKLEEEADRVLGDRLPTLEDLKELKYTTGVINESMRLYPQPPVLIRRALEDDVLGGYTVEKGSDLFISVWNLHRNPDYWPEPDKFDPGRFPVTSRCQTKSPRSSGIFRSAVASANALVICLRSMRAFLRWQSLCVASPVERPADKPAESVGMTTGATIHTLNGLYLNPTPRNHANDTIPSRTTEAVQAVTMAFTSQDKE